MEFEKNSGVQGGWLDKKELKDGDILKLVSEAKEQEGQKGKQIVAKCRIKGQDNESKNVAINKPSKNALIDAFGKDSKDWVNKLLTVTVEKTIVSGKRGIALYLAPEGFELTENDDGYVIIVNKSQKDAKEEVPTIEADEQEIDPDSIPF